MSPPRARFSASTAWIRSPKALTRSPELPPIPSFISHPAKSFALVYEHVRLPRIIVDWRLSERHSRRMHELCREHAAGPANPERCVNRAGVRPFVRPGGAPVAPPRIFLEKKNQTKP